MDKGTVKVQCIVCGHRRYFICTPEIVPLVRQIGSRKCVVFGSDIFLCDFYTGWEMA